MHVLRPESLPAALTWREVIPGVVFILAVDILAIAGLLPAARVENLLSLILIILPWVTLLVMRRSISTLGFYRRALFRAFGWGMVAGGVWRLISMLFNYWWIGLGVEGVPGFSAWLGAIFWVPFVEETFFRGYLGRALTEKFGIWMGIFIQALLFSMQPVHLRQGFPALISIFGFGLIAGWLQRRFDSLWAPWGAHALANAIPLLLFV